MRDESQGNSGAGPGRAARLSAAARVVLIRVRDEILTDASRWTGTVEARDAAGQPVLIHNTRAVAWSLFGALVRAGEDLGPRGEAMDALDAHLCVDGGFVRWEAAPGRTWADIRALLEAVLRADAARAGASPCRGR
jgi:hypothetical protein